MPGVLFAWSGVLNLILMLQLERLFVPVPVFCQPVFSKAFQAKSERMDNIFIIYLTLPPQTMMPLVALVSSKFSRSVKDTSYDVTSPISDRKIKCKFHLSYVMFLGKRRRAR